MQAIALNNISKKFLKSNFHLSLPSLTVEQGYVTGFIGENGAGKSTTLGLVMGMLFPDVGTIQLLGQNCSNPKEVVEARRQVGYVGEVSGYFDPGKLSQIAKMVRPFYETWDDDLFLSLIRRFSLPLDKRHKQLSQGQKKQFALTMALSHHPKLLLLDEPTANLDPLVRSEILFLLSELMESGEHTVFFSTHITSDLDKIADYLKFIHAGTLLLEGEKDALLEGHRIVRGKTEQLNSTLTPLLIDAEKSEFGFSALTHQPQAVCALLGDEAVYERPTVEDIFLYYTRRERSATR